MTVPEILHVLFRLTILVIQCCGSGMFIQDPDFFSSRITDPKTATKERGEKKFVVITFFVVTNFTNFKAIYFLKCLRKKFGPIFKENKTFYLKKLSLCSQNMGLGCGIRDPEKTYSGSRGKKGTGSRIPEPQHCRKFHCI